jgi:hypothetical protein
VLTDPWEPMIREWLKGHDDVTIWGVFNGALGISKDAATNPEQSASRPSSSRSVLFPTARTKAIGARIAIAGTREKVKQGTPDSSDLSS